MHQDSFYNSTEWSEARSLALQRDGHRCTVGRLLGGPCNLLLHVHHIDTVAEHPESALDLDNLITACASHHPRLEALAKALRTVRHPERCPHSHPYPEGRRMCEERRARKMLTAA